MPGYPRINTSLEDFPYKLVGIDRAEAPDGGTGKNWYRYTIIQGSNKIVGYRQGSRRTVTDETKLTVKELNERRAGRKGRVNLTPSPRASRTN